MNIACQTRRDSIFLVKCADFKCLAVRGANGHWQNFQNNVELPGEVEAVLPLPVELILPFLSERKREQLLSMPIPVQH
jgi:hypothetical protein